MGDTFWQRLFRGARRLRQRPQWAAFAGPDWADHIMRVQVADRFHAKQGRTIARWTLHAGGRSLVVYLKRHYRLPWYAGLLALLRPDGRWSPSLQEWDHLEWAHSEGLPAPRAVAGGEYIGPWGRLQSFLAVEELAGMIALHEAVPAAAAALEPATFARWKRGLAAEMASVTLGLHRRRAFHKDLYLCHFYIAEEDTRRLPDWRGRLRIIDLHRLGRHPWTWPWWRVKDLAQLLYSSHVPGVTARDRLRFWRAYLGPDGRGRAARWEAWWIRARAQRHLRRDRRKRAA